MKIKKLLTPLITSSAILAVTPTVCLTSCSAQKEEQNYLSLFKELSDVEYEFTKDGYYSAETYYVFNYKAENKEKVEKATSTIVVTKDNSNFSMKSGLWHYAEGYIVVWIDTIIPESIFNLTGLQKLEFNIVFEGTDWKQTFDEGFCFKAQPVA